MASQKAMPDYSGNSAAEDMKQIIKEYNRKGVIFLAAAIGQDKDAICEIYGQERFIDIGDLRQAAPCGWSRSSRGIYNGKEALGWIV